ncbi:MAG: hypothetical protein R3B84_14505 [Zavarzinella sp.]
MSNFESHDPYDDGEPPYHAKPVFSHYSEVPWYRKSDNCSALIVAHLVLMIIGAGIPFIALLGLFTFCGLIFVCFVVLTGPVYYKKRRKDGTLKTWGVENKIAAVILLLLFGLGTVYSIFG